MSQRVTQSAQGTAAADGTLVLNFDFTPLGYRDIYSVATKCNSSGAFGAVYVGQVLAGYMQSLDQGWCSGFLAEFGEQVTIICAGLLAGDTLTATATITRLTLFEEPGVLTFSGSPISSSTPDSFFAFQETTGTTTIVAAPTAPAFIRVLSCVAGVSYNVTSAGGNVPVVRLVDGAAVVIREMARFWAPNAVSVTIAGGFVTTPQVNFGRGADVAAGQSLAVESSIALTAGRAFAQVEYTIVGLP